MRKDKGAEQGVRLRVSATYNRLHHYYSFCAFVVK